MNLFGRIGQLLHVWHDYLKVSLVLMKFTYFKIDKFLQADHFVLMMMTIDTKGTRETTQWAG